MSIDEKFRELDEHFIKIQNRNKESLETSSIKPIHEKYPLTQNGIVGLIAPPGAGKTFTYLKMAAQQELLFDQPFFELIVICSTSNKFDKTVKSFVETIKKSKVISIKDTDLLDWLNKYMRRILKYNSIIDFIKSEMKDENEEVKRLIIKHRLNKSTVIRGHLKPAKLKIIEYMASKLHKYNWSTCPHRCLLILDDFASHPLLRSKETEMCRLLKKLRHFNINVMICVQTAKSLSKDLKRICTDFILFPGIGEDAFTDLIKESMSSKFDRKELWTNYKTMTNIHDSFRIHIYAGKVVIVKTIQKLT